MIVLIEFCSEVEPLAASILWLRNVDPLPMPLHSELSVPPGASKPLVGSKQLVTVTELVPDVEVRATLLLYMAKPVGNAKF
jgi:hypothetical protein